MPCDGARAGGIFAAWALLAHSGVFVNPDPAPGKTISQGLVHTTHGQALIVMLVMAIGFSVMPLVNTVRRPSNNKDYSRWWEAATAVRAGEALYPPGETEFSGFIYPPGIAALFYAPMSLLGMKVMVAGLCALTFAGHAAAVFASVFLATGGWRGRHWLVYALPIVVTLPFVSDNYFLGQFNLTMLGLMLLGFVALEGRRPNLAGGLLAFAASAKAFPVSALGYLVWRRRWGATLAMLAGLALFTVAAPAALRGVDRHLQESWTWLDRMVLSSSGTSLANQPNRAYRAGNQSLVSVVNRLTRPTETPDDPNDNPANFNANLIDIGPRGAFAIFAGLSAALCLAFVLAMPRQERRTRRSNAMEYAILLLLIVLFSPKAGTYYYCWDIPAITIITAEILAAPIGSRRRRWLIGGLAGAVAILVTALTQALEIPGPQTYGATMRGSMTILVILLALLWDAGRSGPISAADPALLCAAGATPSDPSAGGGCEGGR